MNEDNEDGPCTFPGLTVSDPCLSNTHEISPFKSDHGDHYSIDRSSSDAKVLYSNERKETSDTIESPTSPLLKLRMKEPTKSPTPHDEGTDIDEACYCHHKYCKGIKPQSDYTYRTKQPSGPTQTISDGPSSSQAGLHGPQPTPSPSSRATNTALLELVIEQSQTDEGTDLDKTHYLYHKHYKGIMPPIKSYTHSSPSFDSDCSSDVFPTNTTEINHAGSPLLSAKTRPTDMDLLERVIELSQTDEGTDLDQAYYRYHKCYMGVIPLSDYSKCRLSNANDSNPLRQTTTYVPGAKSPLHDMRPHEQALMSAQVLLSDKISNA